MSQELNRDNLPDYTKPEGLKMLAETFTYHAPKNNQLPRYQDIRGAAHNLAVIIEKHCPPSREKSIAITKLQEVSMFANASIAIHENLPSQPDPVSPPPQA